MNTSNDSHSSHRFRADVIVSLDAILRSCEERHRPLQEEPSRSELFDLFAAAALRGDVAGPAASLSADVVCAELASRWGLKSTVQESAQRNSGLTPAQMSQMRQLWGLVQMWMEWTYAWDRWPDFHPHATAAESPQPHDS